MKILTYLLVVLFLGACTQSHHKTVKKNIKAKSATAVKKSIKNKTFNFTNPLLTTYSAYLDTLNKKDIETSHQAVEKFSQLFAQSDANICDTAFCIFDRYYRKQCDLLDDLHTSIDLTKYDSLLYADSLTKLSPELMLYKQKLYRNGFRLISEEGMSYITQDGDLVSSSFYDKINVPLKIFLEQENKENKQRSEEDASIIISSSELISRLVWWEDFVNKNHNFIRNDDAVGDENYYLLLMLNGSDNSWLMDDKSNLVDFFVKASKYLQVNYPQSIGAQIIPQYYKAIHNHNKETAKKILKPYYKLGILTAKDYISFGKN